MSKRLHDEVTSVKRSLKEVLIPIGPSARPGWRRMILTLEPLFHRPLHPTRHPSRRGQQCVFDMLTLGH